MNRVETCWFVMEKLFHMTITRISPMFVIDFNPSFMKGCSNVLNKCLFLRAIMQNVLDKFHKYSHTTTSISLSYQK